MLKLKKSHSTMAKRSNRHPPRQNKEQPGCMSGLIGIFDFRHGRITRRMLADRRHATKNTVGPASPSSDEDLLTTSEEIPLSIENASESEKQTFDIIKPSVKELMEEEMFIEQGPKNQINGGEVESFDSECNSHEKPSTKSLDNHEISIGQQNSSQKTSQYHDLEAVMKQLLLMHNGAFSEEKINLAVEAFLNEKTHNSKDLIDTFLMLNTDKEQFLKLFQDQNSLLLSEDEKSKSIARSNSFDIVPKHRNFFRRRSKSQEHVSLKGNESPSRIVVLKPDSPENLIKKENEVHSERIISHFSFMEIKKKLKNAIGKDQSKPKKTSLEGSNGWSSPNRNHFYTERFASFSNGFKREEKISNLQKNDEIEDSSNRISNIYIEAKKHLSEMLKSEDEDEEFTKKTLSKSLGKLLSLPEYNSVSPRGNFHLVNESQPCETNNPEEKFEVSEDVDHGDLVEDNRSSVREDMSAEGVLEIVQSPSTDVEYQEETEIVDISSEPCSSSKSIDDDDNHVEIENVFEEERSPRFLKKLDLIEENEFSSPTTSPMGSKFAEKTEELGGVISDGTERPSPVSVLEPLFSDNDISPASTLSRHSEAGIRPLRIRFEEIFSSAEDQDQEIHIRNCPENEESAFEYIEAVLLASDLNWNDFEKRWLSSLQILDSSLFNEVEIFSNRPHHDQRLLFDSTNEILKEVCDSYLGSFFDSSTVQRNVDQPVPKGIDLINEVWEKMESHLYSLRPRFLDRLVKNDLEISKMWMNLRYDTREIVFKMEESFFEDMIDDTLSSLVIDRVNNESSQKS